MTLSPTPKALAIDLDGTLLIGETLSERNRNAVRQAHDEGLHVIIATARWRQLAERIAAEIGLGALPIIACSGAQVYSTASRADVYDERLPREFVEPLFDIINQHRCIASATLSNHSLLKIDVDPGADYLTEELRWVEVLPEADELPRIATVQGTETIRLVRELHASGFADKVNIFDSIGPSGRIVITITSKGADKGIALGRACDYLEIEPETVVAFGDAHNDIEMFRVAGWSVAMGQADDEVKAAASAVTASNEEDGVARFIEENLLR